MSNKPAKKTLFTIAAVSAALLSTAAIAATGEREPAQSAHVMQPASHQSVQIRQKNGKFKTIRLLDVHLSNTAKGALLKNLRFSLAHPYAPSNSLLPPATDTGMNNVPVLDQGQWGTCVTFATTAAIDALYPLKGDQTVSQLCSLELGKTLQIPDSDGGWNGSYGNLVLNEISQYGYLTTAWQTKNGCGGLKEYPLYSTDNGKAMPVSQYTKDSIKTFTKTSWTTLLNDNDNPDLFDPAKKEQLLDTIKQNLAAGYRTTFGVILDPDAENAGAFGNVSDIEAAWVISDQVISDIKAGKIAGHEMVIIGYDDNACATWIDEITFENKKQCGLLKLRNSWSAMAGDDGDYYMSYDYFKNLAIESYLIGKS